VRGAGPKLSGAVGVAFGKSLRNEVGSGTRRAIG